MQEFIRSNGVTRLPGMGTKELAAMNVARERAQAESGSWRFGGWTRKRKRRRA